MDVKINIRTIQYDKDGNKDKINLDTKGTMYEKNNDTYIVYKEKEENESITTTTIKISKGEVTIKRFGQVNSTMIFEKDEKNITKYRTAQGLFIIETETRDLAINKSKENYINLEIDYNIKIMDLFEGRNKIQINIENII